MADAAVPPASDPGPGREVIIIGSGPAGLTAAIYAARAGLAPLVLEGEASDSGDQPGGQLMTTTEVENYPGFVEGVQGPELMGAFRAQAARFGAELVSQRATRVDFSARPLRVWVGEEEHRARAVIVSTGARATRLGLEGEARLLGRGVSTCATCDGFFFRGREVAAVGGGDSALEEAIFLSRFASKVTVIHRRSQLRASKIMAERAGRNERIRFVWECEVTEVVGGDALEAVVVTNVVSAEQTRLAVAGLFVAIGHVPNSALFAGQLETDRGGYLITRGRSSATNVAGVFACGDVADPTYRQAVTAAGSGCTAAIDAERWLEADHDAGAEPAPEPGGAGAGSMARRPWGTAVRELWADDTQPGAGRLR